METVAESGKGEWSPVSKHQIQPGCGEWAGWRGTGQPNLTRETKLSGANGDRENSIFLVQLTTSRIGNHTRLIPNLLKVTTTHTHHIISALWLQQKNSSVSRLCRPRAEIPLYLWAFTLSFTKHYALYRCLQVWIINSNVVWLESCTFLK